MLSGKTNTQLLGTLFISRGYRFVGDAFVFSSVLSNWLWKSESINVIKNDRSAGVIRPFENRMELKAAYNNILIRVLKWIVIIEVFL